MEILTDPRFWYRASVLKISDGDTAHLAVNLGHDVTRRDTYRFAHIDAPERGTEAGTAATVYVTLWLQENGVLDADGRWQVLIRTIRDVREKFGRYLCEVYSLKNPAVCLNDDLIASGHAVPYGGGSRA